MNYLLLLIAFISLLFAHILTPHIAVTERITAKKNMIILKYDNALEGAMINLWVLPIVHDINQGILGGNPFFDEVIEEYETIEIEDNEP